MKYMKVNWFNGNKNGIFTMCGETFDELIVNAESYADYEDLNIHSYEVCSEDEYEECRP